MKVTVEEHGTAELVAAFTAAPEKIRRQWVTEAYDIGAKAVELIKRGYRTTGTEPGEWGPSTWRRSAQLVRSYAHQVTREGSDVVLDLGAIRPTDAGQVPIQARVMEGFDRNGNRVEQFIIRAKRAPYLVFPIRRGGGLSKANIIGWVKTKRVTLKPRPAIEPVGKNLVAVLEERGATVVTDAA